MVVGVIVRQGWTGDSCARSMWAGWVPGTATLAALGNPVAHARWVDATPGEQRGP